MGVRLIVEVLDHRPPGLPDKHVLALIAVAERANDKTRIGWPRRAEVAHRMGASEATAKRTLISLTERKLLIVTQPGGGRGRPTHYFVVPLKTGSLMSDPVSVSVTGSPASVDNSDTGSSLGDPVSAPKPGHPKPETGSSDTETGSSKHSDQHRDSITLIRDNPHLSRAYAEIASSIDATEDEMRAIIEKIQREHAPRSLPAFLSAMADNGDLHPILDSIREDRNRVTIRAAVEEARRGPECPHGEKGGATLHPVAGTPLCALCRASARKGSAA